MQCNLQIPVLLWWLIILHPMAGWTITDLFYLVSRNLPCCIWGHRTLQQNTLPCLCKSKMCYLAPWTQEIQVYKCHYRKRSSMTTNMGSEYVIYLSPFTIQDSPVTDFWHKILMERDFKVTPKSVASYTFRNSWCLICFYLSPCLSAHLWQ